MFILGGVHVIIGPYSIKQDPNKDPTYIVIPVLLSHMLYGVIYWSHMYCATCMSQEVRING